MSRYIIYTLSDINCPNTPFYIGRKHSAEVTLDLSDVINGLPPADRIAAVQLHSLNRLGLQVMASRLDKDQSIQLQHALYDRYSSSADRDNKSTKYATIQVDAHTKSSILEFCRNRNLRIGKFVEQCCLTVMSESLWATV
jgi:hypothetical protein